MQKSEAEKFLKTLFKINRLLRNRNYNKAHLTQLSILQLHALVFLNENKNCQMTDIAKQFTIELPSATSLLNKLCTMKLVTRETDSVDRRIIRLQITKRGRTLLKEAMSEQVNHIQQVLTYLSKKDSAELLRILQYLNDKMEKTND